MRLTGRENYPEGVCSQKFRRSSAGSGHVEVVNGFSEFVVLSPRLQDCLHAWQARRPAT